MTYLLLLIPLVFFGANLEVFLPTRTSLPPVYLSGFKNEEMRAVLEEDLNRSGLCAVVSKDLEDSFDVTYWKKEKISFCLFARVVSNRLESTAFNVENGTTKKYPAIPLERAAIHRLADAVQKDFFGLEGISSLKLIYTVRSKNKNTKGLGWLSEVWVCDADGKNPIQVTRENSYCLCPAFLSNSATDFFYVSEKSGQSKIYRASLANPKGELMVDLRGNQVLATVKGTKIAFISDVAGRPDLFIQSLDNAGKARQLYSAPRATQASPTFSPDGKRVAFVSDRDGPPRIYLLDVNSKKTSPQLLTKKNRENTSPAWSPDGTKLAYSAKVDDVRQIWIYDFSTGEEIPLTNGPENKENPSWAPDSFHLVYNTENEEHCDLYVMHLKSTEPTRIGKGRFASWQQR